MKLKMAENSLFAILLRSPWWISLAIAAVLIVASGALLPARYVPFGVFAALPFLVIAAIAGWRQLRAPSPARIAETLAGLQQMSLSEFSAAVESAFVRTGHSVDRLKRDAGADFELTRSGRRTLLVCKRWKAARTGIEPLRELQATMAAREVHEGLYAAAGEISDKARRYAAANGIRLLEGPELAALLSSALRASGRPPAIGTSAVTGARK